MRIQRLKFLGDLLAILQPLGGKISLLRTRLRAHARHRPVNLTQTIITSTKIYSASTKISCKNKIYSILQVSKCMVSRYEKLTVKGQKKNCLTECGKTVG